MTSDYVSDYKNEPDPEAKCYKLYSGPQGIRCLITAVTRRGMNRYMKDIGRQSEQCRDIDPKDVTDLKYDEIWNVYA